MTRQERLQGLYYYRDVIVKAKARGLTNEAIAEFLSCSISTVKYCIRHNNGQISHPPALASLGEVSPEYLRVAAVYRCREFLAKRGWQTGESDPKCVYDVFAIKDGFTIKVQVRSTTHHSNRGWPSFKLTRLKFNTKRCETVSFKTGDFDYWFFYAPNGDNWIIPFEIMLNKRDASMEGYDDYFVG
jgi:hypothetical protein